MFFKNVRKAFPTNQGNFYHIKEEAFLVKRGIFIIASLTEEIFIHIYLRSQKNFILSVTVQLVRRKQKIQEVFFSVLSFDHLLDKTIVTYK